MTLFICSIDDKSQPSLIEFEEKTVFQKGQIRKRVTGKQRKALHVN